MKQCNTCDIEQPEFYASQKTRDGLRGECRTCTGQYARRRERAGGALRYRRRVRTVHNTGGNDSFVVAIPPAVYQKLGRPHAIRWTIQDGEVGLEVVE